MSHRRKGVADFRLLSMHANPLIVSPGYDDTQKDCPAKRHAPVYRGCSMNDQVPKQSHNTGNNQGDSEHFYKISEFSREVHFSASLGVERRCDVPFRPLSQGKLLRPVAPKFST